MFARLPLHLVTELASRGENLNLLQVVPSKLRLNVARGLYLVDPCDTIGELISNHQLNTLRLLVDEQQPELTRNHLRTALATGSTEAVSYLLLNNVPLHTNDLDLAAGSGSVELVEYLARLGLHPSEHAVTSAARRGQLAMVQYLIERGVEPTTDALVGGAASGRVDILEYLYQVLTRDLTPIDSPHDVECNNQSDQLTIPLEAFTKATKRGHLAVIQWLFDHGGRGMSVREYNQELEDDYRWTLYDVAYGSGQHHVTEWLVDQGVPAIQRDQALMFARRANSYPVVTELFGKHSDLVADVINGLVDRYVTGIDRVPGLVLFLKLLHSRGITQVDVAGIARRAARNGNRLLLRYVLEHAPRLAPSSEIDLKRIAQTALRSGHYSIVDDLLRLGSVSDPEIITDLVTADRYILWKIIKNDYVNSLDYLHRQGVTIPPRAAQRALRHGSLRVAIYLLRLGYQFEQWYETPIVDLFHLVYEQLGLPPERIVNRYITGDNLFAIEFLASHGYQFIPEHVTMAIRYQRLNTLKILYRHGYRDTTKLLGTIRWYDYQRFVRFLDEHEVDGESS